MARADELAAEPNGRGEGEEEQLHADRRGEKPRDIHRLLAAVVQKPASETAAYEQPRKRGEREKGMPAAEEVGAWERSLVIAAVAFDPVFEERASPGWTTRGRERSRFCTKSAILLGARGFIEPRVRIEEELVIEEIGDVPRLGARHG